jgi:putative hydrolase of the HAD superfamily
VTKGRPEAILFDLYGTLVLPFRRREHQQTLARCAEILGIDVEECLRHWRAGYDRRATGEISSVAESLSLIAAACGAPLDERIEAAEAVYLEFTREGIRPLPGVIDMLRELRASGSKLAVVSNCMSDVAAVWGDSPFAGCFDKVTLSCEVGHVKPHPEIYERALRALEVNAQDALFVGDGSDHELTGAEACGLRCVLVEADLSNTYDDVRVDVERWTGERIVSITDLPALLRLS